MSSLDFDQRLGSTMNRIDESEHISAYNKDLLRDFKRDLMLQGLSKAWLDKLLSTMKVISEYLKSDKLDELDKDDVKDLVEWVQERDISDATVRDYKQVIRRFWKWLNDGKHPEETAWISINNQHGNGILPKDLLTQDDIDALLDGCRNSRDKAFIALLWESGARIGEIIDLTVGDLEDQEHGKKIVIDGKTGQRRLPLIESTPYLSRWISDHPNPEKDAPLWCKLNDGGSSLTYEYIRQKLLGRAAKRADIEKPVNPHHFRHSRATYLANEITESQLRVWFGWSPGSSTPSKYVHLSGRDIDDTYQKLHGVKSEEEEEEDQTVEQCPRCDEINQPDAAFCVQCGQGLDAGAIMEVETAEEKTTETASTEDFEMAQQLVQAMQNDRDTLEEFLDSLD